ncbi:hypothetical protein FRUB_10261 [Fimbriiglobus ruber]|uniref:Uncharacterized protein n=1 Tax=Fimbriiglobus ruber TaxID=1908690 RepID=A0A225CY42_9BACT|nr:hypothetical protein FRUB_10261 [Fimbriiglobus ruber]
MLQAAKDDHAYALKTFDDLDVKAAALIGYFSGGAGLVVVGAIAGIAEGKIGPATAIGIMPAFACAIASIVYGILVRQVGTVYRPSVTLAARYAADLTETGEVAFAGQWVLATALTLFGCDRKARLLMVATILSACSVGLLAVPLACAIVEQRAKVKTVAVPEVGPVERVKADSHPTGK